MHRLMNPFVWADGGAQERSAWDPHKHGILERLGHNFKDTYTYHTNPQGLADHLHNFTLM